MSLATGSPGSTWLETGGMSVRVDAFGTIRIRVGVGGGFGTVSGFSRESPKIAGQLRQNQGGPTQIKNAL